MKENNRDIIMMRNYTNTTTKRLIKKCENLLGRELYFILVVFVA